MEAFSNLKKLRLYKLYITDISKIFTLKELKEVRLQGVKVSKPNNFEEILIEEGIEPKKIKTLEEKIRDQLKGGD